jgi:hypothetical protein
MNSLGQISCTIWMPIQGEIYPEGCFQCSPVGALRAGEGRQQEVGTKKTNYFADGSMEQIHIPTD